MEDKRNITIKTTPQYKCQKGNESKWTTLWLLDPFQTRLNTGEIRDVSGTTTNCCLPVATFTVSVGYANSL